MQCIYSMTSSYMLSTTRSSNLQSTAVHQLPLSVRRQPGNTIDQPSKQ